MRLVNNMSARVRLGKSLRVKVKHHSLRPRCMLTTPSPNWQCSCLCAEFAIFNEGILHAHVQYYYRRQVLLIMNSFKTDLRGFKIQNSLGACLHPPLDTCVFCAEKLSRSRCTMLCPGIFRILAMPLLVITCLSCTMQIQTCKLVDNICNSQANQVCWNIDLS